MLFGDVVAALRELRRVLRPGPGAGMFSRQGIV